MLDFEILKTTAMPSSKMAGLNYINTVVLKRLKAAKAHTHFSLFWRYISKNRLRIPMQDRSIWSAAYTAPQKSADCFYDSLCQQKPWQQGVYKATSLGKRILGPIYQGKQHQED